jgi:hypothetical protein
MLEQYFADHAAALKTHNEAVTAWEDARDAYGVGSALEVEAWERREATLAHLLAVTVRV